MARTRASIARVLLDSAPMRAGLAEICGRTGLSPAEARRRARAALLEMVCVQAPAFRFLLDRAVGGLHTRAWSFDVDWPALDRLRATHPDASLVFLPTHRSYADAFVLMRVLVAGRMPPAYVLGGDNLRFFPLGTIGRRAGVIFIRRSFKDDEIYKLALRRYMHHLVASGAHLEWYMEGGRSRTGKLRAPHYGLLHYLVEAQREAAGRDVLLVPVSITYEQLQDIGAMAAEEAGAAKPREGFGWLANYLRDQGRRLGRAYVRFGAPLSLGESSGSLDKVAFEVFQRINRVTPVTGPALVTLALLGVDDRALGLRDLHAFLQPLLDYAARRGLPTGALDGLREPAGLAQVLDGLVAAGIVRRAGETLRIAPGQDAVAAYYRNSAIHWFVNRAILELGIMVASRAGEGEGEAEGAGDALARGMATARAWRDLLKFEFFFSERRAFDEEIAGEARLLEPDIGLLASGRTLPRFLLESAPFLVAHRILPAFLEAYGLVADRLAGQPVDAPVEEKPFLAGCLEAGRRLVAEKRLRSPEAASRELLANGFALAANRGLLGPGDEALAVQRRRFAAEIAEALAALADIAALDAARPAARTAA
ncbi:MAG: 1-acyl-sn-glycerol-3-phosphate acyltransferase [Proteobacteria bacterium]|nr:1-acyl-sn-glycerol-3-phosphate acyltransferase [Pseudomonadota bacterium]